METSDFLQADDIYKVIQVPFAVAKRKTTDDEIESHIGTNSSGRQGRYYRLAAEKLGLVTNENNHSSLTNYGHQLIALPDSAMQIKFIADRMRVTDVFSQAIHFLESTVPSPTERDLRQWFISVYPGSEGTAERRFSTFVKYLRETGFI
jgi:hypothetical protein